MSLRRATFSSIKCAIGSLYVFNSESAFSEAACMLNFCLALSMTIVFLIEIATCSCATAY